MMNSHIIIISTWVWSEVEFLNCFNGSLCQITKLKDVTTTEFYFYLIFRSLLLGQADGGLSPRRDVGLLRHAVHVGVAVRSVRQV
jgi:hypothetical protein